MRWLARLASDLTISIIFYTRLPIARSVAIEAGDLARASWAMPLAGAMVGAIGGAAYWIAYRLGLAPSAAAALALTVTLLVTGCLHEDGLADTADGFGGGKTRERKLEIMRDSRIGTYGVCALVISLLLRWSALAAFADPIIVIGVLIAAHASARATLPALMRFVPPARTDGLSAAAGQPPQAAVAAAALLGAVALAALGLIGAIASLVLLAGATATLAWLSLRQIGGQTGDVLGTLEQIGEVLVLLTAAALLRG